MEQLQFNPDEHPTSLQKIEKIEEVWDTKLPQDYKEFLLKVNGGEVQPSIPTIGTTTQFEIWQIERFCSVDDLILQKKYPMGYTYIEEHQDENLEKFGVNRNDLLTIAIAERGCYYINLSKEQYGQMYVADYQGGDGFGKLKTNSFSEFLNSLKPFPNYHFKNFENTRKIYERYFYYTPNNPVLGLERFYQVLSYFGNANTKSRESDWSVIQHYAYVSPYDKMGSHLFNYLLNNGGSTDGLLLRTRDFETIKTLIKAYGLNFNTKFNERYPIENLVGISSWSAIKENYELLDRLLNSEIEIDLSVLNHKEKTVTQQLKDMVIEYEKFREYDINFWKSRPEMHKFITSEKINDLIKNA
jgi:hypothetical protein